MSVATLERTSTGAGTQTGHNEAIPAGGIEFREAVLIPTLIIYCPPGERLFSTVLNALAASLPPSNWYSMSRAVSGNGVETMVLGVLSQNDVPASVIADAKANQTKREFTLTNS